MRDVFATDTSLTFLRLQFTIDNPYSEFEYINITITNTNDQVLGTGVHYISSYTPAIMQNCQVESQSQVAFASTTHTYSFTPTQRLIADSYILITLPNLQISTGSSAVGPLTCTGLEGTDSVSLPCSIQSPTTNQNINISSGIVNSNHTSAPIRISLSLLRNPVSLEPFGPITINFMYQSTIVQTCSGIYNTITVPSKMNSFIIIGMTGALTIGSITSNSRISYALTSNSERPTNNLFEVKLQLHRLVTQQKHLSYIRKALHFLRTRHKLHCPTFQPATFLGSILECLPRLESSGSL